jgi:hypothetical protein
MADSLKLMAALSIIGLASIPLGLWKLGEIAWWIWSNLHWGTNG